MKNKFCFFIILFFTFGALLFARGSSEEIEAKTQNDEWILCISNFDTTLLPESKNSIAGVIMKKLVDSVNSINFRTRVADEYAFYEENAFARERSEKAKAIAAKQDERSMLAYKGDAEWKYRRNIEKVDAELKELYLQLEEIDKPLINNQPEFNLTRDNQNYIFPDTPAAGNEYRFCLDQKSDAMITGTIFEFYERFVVSLKLYTISTRSFVWEESVIFSFEDMDNVMKEYARSLIVMLSGNEPAVFTVKAQPDEALLLVNGAFSGRGETSVTEIPPGLITVNASAPEHENATFVTELFSGEHTEIELSLKPVEYVDVEITGTPGSKVYHGALYVGESPLTLRLPLNQLEYIETETPDSAKSLTVLYAHGGSDLNHSLILPDAIPSDKGRVDKARRNFYLSFAGTWIAGAAAWISYHSYANSNAAISSSYYRTGSYDQGFYDRGNRMYYVSMGTLIATGVAVVLDIFFINRYIKAANKGTAAVTETGGK